MKNTIAFFTVLLVLWIAGCSWFYVCKVRMHCNADPGFVQVTEQAAITVSDTVTAPEPEPLPPLPPDYTIWFNSGTNSCRLSDADQQHFALVKQFIADNPGCRLVVTGYADNTGPESLNLRISSERAEFIKSQLLETGIPAGTIATSGMGEMEPLADNSSLDGRAKNRRVEIQTNKN